MIISRNNEDIQMKSRKEVFCGIAGKLTQFKYSKTVNPPIDVRKQHKLR